MTAPWTAVILSRDLLPGTVVPALGPHGPLAVWRGRSGVVSASADRCPHRGMRLSAGFVRGDVLSCIYHGWRFGQSGRCLGIPAHPGLVPPDAIHVACLRTAESDGVVWVAAENVAGAPPSHEGFEGLRSLTVKAGPAAVAAIAGPPDAEGCVRTILADHQARLQLAAAPDGETTLHVLMETGLSPDEKLAASRAAEALRRAVEATSQTEPAS